jgi:UPF0176 protein
MSVVVATFYKFVPVEDGEALQRSLQDLCAAVELYGTILVAEEGLNATIAGDESAIAALLDFLRSDARFSDLTAKYSTAATPPFGQMKVKIKREIVTLGQPEANPTDQVGTYVPPTEWNRLITDPDVVLIDARNDYEVNIGTFQGAVNPHTDSFRELPDYLTATLNPQHHKKVAMFCTGGIRCEKATSYLLRQGFEQVYHLQGGILQYLEEVPETESLWEGECFVFDERVAVRHGLQLGSHELCYACGNPVSPEDQAKPHYEPGISCPHCYDQMTPQRLAKQRLRKLQHDQQQGYAL